MWLILLNKNIDFFNTLFSCLLNGQGKQWPTSSHRYCGNGQPIDYLSSSRTIYVHFKSDDDIQESGFKFTAKVFSGE